MSGRTGRVALMAALALAASCRVSVPGGYPPVPQPGTTVCGSAPCAGGDSVTITYLGVAGFLIAHHGKSILTGPSFTNPSFDSVTPTRYRFFRGRAPVIGPDPALIERLLPTMADRASMILVGHGHYDHLLDVPYIATHRALDARIVGGPTVRHMLMGDSVLRASPSRLVAIDTADAGTVDRAGKWLYSDDGAFRVMALKADHAPTVRIFHRRSLFANAVIDHDLDHLPPKAEDWKLGEPYSFLIDVLAPGDTAPAFRIYFQDAPNTAPLGFPPRSLGGRPIDVAILCVATARNVSPESPDSLLTVLKPGFVIASHWESFFRPQTLPIMLNVASDLDAFSAILARRLPSTAGWAVPMPQATLRFAPTTRR